MKQPNVVSRVLDENGIIKASSVPGEVGKRSPRFTTQVNTEPEKLLPTGYAEGGPYGSRQKSVADVKAEERERNRPEMVKRKRPVATDEEPLYPLGIKIEE